MSFYFSSIRRHLEEMKLPPCQTTSHSQRSAWFPAGCQPEPFRGSSECNCSTFKINICFLLWSTTTCCCRQLWMLSRRQCCCCYYCPITVWSTGRQSCQHMKIYRTHDGTLVLSSSSSVNHTRVKLQPLALILRSWRCWSPLIWKASSARSFRWEATHLEDYKNKSTCTNLTLPRSLDEWKPSQMYLLSHQR